MNKIEENDYVIFNNSMDKAYRVIYVRRKYITIKGTWDELRDYKIQDVGFLIKSKDIKVKGE